jgi:putative tryptophan/tyrosine transport system substrate-binding protein
MTAARFFACVMLALFAPLVAQAQPAVKTWRLGMLTVNAPEVAGAHPIYKAFFAEMRALGYRESENLVVEWRHTQGDHERRRREAALLMAWKPDAVFTVSGVNAIALRDASATVPIVVGTGGDLVGMRLAETLARPGGNVTGLQILSPDLAQKRLQLLKELVPKLQRVALLHATAEEDRSFYDRIYADLQSAAPAAGMTVSRIIVPSAPALESAFGEIAAKKVDAVLIVASPFMTAHRQRVLDLAAQRRVPAMYEVPEDAERGGLIAYGPKFDAMFRRAAHYVDRVLKGARPEELPIQQPDEFELVINRRSAAALGLKLPQSLLVRADRVID